MKQKAKIFLIVVLGVVMTFLVLQSVPPKGVKVVEVPHPTFLRIPILEIRAPIIPMDITSAGDMAAPETPEETGWYVSGPRPGEEGSAVIDGHAGWKDNIPAVFDSLHKLSIGDKIFVDDEKGITTVFVVYKTKVFDKDADTAEVFVSNDGKAHLNLITCAGQWNETEKSSEERLVVFAVKQ